MTSQPLHGRYYMQYICSGLPFPSPTWWMIAMHFTMIMHSRHWSGLPCPSPGDLPWPRDQIHISCIAGGFFTHWGTWKVQSYHACMPVKWLQSCPTLCDPKATRLLCPWHSLPRTTIRSSNSTPRYTYKKKYKNLKKIYALQSSY